MRYGEMLVHQLVPSHLLLQTEQQSSVLFQIPDAMMRIVFAIVVVSPHREDAIGRMQFLQIIHISLHLAGIIVHQVAGKEHHLHPLGIGTFHHLLYEVRTLREGTQMEIAEMQNLVSVEIRRKIGR